MVAASLACSSSSTVSLVISLLATSVDYDMIDVQLGLAKAPFVPFVSQTARTDAMSIEFDDLPPGTNFAVAMRMRSHHDGFLWTNLTQPVVCSTAALSRYQPRLLPPSDLPTTDSVILDVELEVLDRSRIEVPLDVQYRQQSDLTWLRAKTSPIMARHPETNLRLSAYGLAAGQVYEFRARAAFKTRPGGAQEWGPFSDSVVYRTANAGKAFIAPLEVYRVTEHCGETCPPDFLKNHNAGDLLADVSFITAMSDPTAKPNPFIKSFEVATITKYCVSRHLKPFADYVSCNGANPETTECACNNYIDRCIARMDEGNEGFGSGACDMDSTRTDTAGMPFCTCSPSSIAASKESIGILPVYFPFPRELDERGALQNPIRSCSVPSQTESTFLGHWYSFPAEGECTPGSVPTEGCSWSRRSWQHFVHGHELLALGFNTSSVSQHLQQLRHNENIIAQVFRRLPRAERCCGC